MSTETAPRPLTEPSPQEAADSMMLGVQFARADAVTAVSNRRISSGAGSIRAQLELLEYIRRARPVVVEPEGERTALHLAWRLVLATALAITVLTTGVTLTVAALSGASLRPAPLLALSVLLAGVVLTATLMAALRTG